jgi:competence ComEA-like helix-hairpin-helix protein
MMWGRELRAGMIFVVVSTAAGIGFRDWQRAHHAQFEEIVRSLVEADAAASRAETDSPATGLGEAAVGSPSDGTVARAPGPGGPGGPQGQRAGRRDSAMPPRAASIDVDRAGAEELIRLPGIGPALAARIVAERGAGGRFGGPDGLLRVPGIGPKTLAKIRPYLAPPSDSSSAPP